MRGERNVKGWSKAEAVLCSEETERKRKRGLCTKSRIGPSVGTNTHSNLRPFLYPLLALLYRVGYIRSPCYSLW
jgi:hypothetical protein